MFPEEYYRQWGDRKTLNTILKIDSALSIFLMCYLQFTQGSNIDMLLLDTISHKSEAVRAAYTRTWYLRPAGPIHRGWHLWPVGPIQPANQFHLVHEIRTSVAIW